MRKIALAGCLALVAAGVAGATGDGADSIATSDNAFALDLFHRLATEPGNRFFSPYSIHAALTMTYAGARSRTASEMAGVLHLQGPADRVHAAYGDLITVLNAGGGPAGPSKGYELVVADALFGQNGFPFLEPFRTTCRDRYRAHLANVDFAGAVESARRQINDWVSRETRGRILDLLSPGSLDASTRLVLANAVYFKGRWAERFNEASTVPAPFDLGTGRKVEARFMNQTARFGYAETPDLQLLEMPYEGGDLSMIVLLPKKPDGLGALETSLSEAALARLVESASRRQVRVSLPRFRLTSAFDLTRTLGSMGMSDAFSREAADFSGMTGAGRLFIGAVVHKAFVDVNEEGTEAAAATGIGMTLASLPPPVPAFVADHPFLFLIRHDASGAILFLGRIADPTRES